MKVDTAFVLPLLIDKCAVVVDFGQFLVSNEMQTVTLSARMDYIAHVSSFQSPVISMLWIRIYVYTYFSGWTLTFIVRVITWGLVSCIPGNASRVARSCTVTVTSLFRYTSELPSTCLLRRGVHVPLIYCACAIDRACWQAIAVALCASVHACWLSNS